MTMQFINYFLALIISYLGFIIGMVLVKIAPEEQKPGKIYFLLLQKILLIIIIIFLLIFYKTNIFVIILSIVLLFFIIKKFKAMHEKKSFIIYLFLGIIFYLSSKNINNLMIISSLIFLYGIPTSSLLINFKEKNYFKILFNHITYIILALILFFMF